MVVFQWLSISRAETIIFVNILFDCCKLWASNSTWLQKGGKYLTSKSSQNGGRPPSAARMAFIIIGWRSKSFWTSSVGRWSHASFFAYWHSSPDVRDLIEHCNTCSQIQSRQAYSHVIVGDIRLVRDPQNEFYPFPKKAVYRTFFARSWIHFNSMVPYHCYKHFGVKFRNIIHDHQFNPVTSAPRSDLVQKYICHHFCRNLCSLIVEALFRNTINKYCFCPRNRQPLKYYHFRT